MNVKKIIYGAFGVSGALTAALVYILANDIDKEYYMNGMFRDASIQSQLTKDEIDNFIASGILESRYEYLNKSSALTINGYEPDALLVTHVLSCPNSEKMCAMQSGLHPITTNNKPGDGFGLRVIKGQLYTFSEGAIRSKPSDYAAQLHQAAQDAVSVSEWYKRL